MLGNTDQSLVAVLDAGTHTITAGRRETHLDSIVGSLSAKGLGTTFVLSLDLAKFVIVADDVGRFRVRVHNDLHGSRALDQAGFASDLNRSGIVLVLVPVVPGIASGDLHVGGGYKGINSRGLPGFALLDDHILNDGIDATIAIDPALVGYALLEFLKLILHAIKLVVLALLFGDKGDTLAALLGFGGNGQAFEEAVIG